MERSYTQPLLQNRIKKVKNIFDRVGGLYSLITAFILIALEVFSYSTTQFALSDLLGEIGFGPTSWATILAAAFCGMDLVGIARLFSPRSEQEQDKEGWLLLGAWLVSVIMNTCLTWWGVSIAIYNHPVESILVVDPMKIVTIIPIFVALMVLIARILIIGVLANKINALSKNENYTHRKQPIASEPMAFKPLRRKQDQYGRQPIPNSNKREFLVPRNELRE